MEYVLIDYDNEYIIYDGDLGEYCMIDTTNSFNNKILNQSVFNNDTITQPISILAPSPQIINETINSYGTKESLIRGIENDVNRSIVNINEEPVNKKLFLKKIKDSFLNPIFSQAAVAIPFIHLRNALPEDVHLGEIPISLINKYNNQLIFNYNDINETASINKKVCSFTLSNDHLSVLNIYDMNIFIDKSDSIINIDLLNPKNYPIFISNY